MEVRLGNSQGKHYDYWSRAEFIPSLWKFPFLLLFLLAKTKRIVNLPKLKRARSVLYVVYSDSICNKLQAWAVSYCTHRLCRHLGPCMWWPVCRVGRMVFLMKWYLYWPSYSYILVRIQTGTVPAHLHLMSCHKSSTAISWAAENVRQLAMLEDYDGSGWIRPDQEKDLSKSVKLELNLAKLSDIPNRRTFSATWDIHLFMHAEVQKLNSYAAAFWTEL